MFFFFFLLLSQFILFYLHRSFYIYFGKGSQISDFMLTLFFPAKETHVGNALQRIAIHPSGKWKQILMPAAVITETSRVTRVTLVLWIGNETLCELSRFGNAPGRADCLKPV